MIIIAGPCLAESYTLCEEVAGALKEAIDGTGIDFYFKASFDKANRTSLDSPRGSGMDKGLDILLKVKTELGVKILTDVHETNQVTPVSYIADAIQIPAMLCRQTDLIVKSAEVCLERGLKLNIKKGQFLSGRQMLQAQRKALSTGLKVEDCWLTERGNTYGYGDIVVDFRNIIDMQKFAPVIYDATHSVQSMGLDVTGGSGMEYSIDLLSCALCLQPEGLFFETHPNPAKALSDKHTQFPLKKSLDIIEAIKVNLLGE